MKWFHFENYCLVDLIINFVKEKWEFFFQLIMIHIFKIDDKTMI